MKRAIQRLIRLLRKPNRWHSASAIIAILICLSAWRIGKKTFLTLPWGIINDEIAVITIEEGDLKTNTPEKITVVVPNKSLWDGLELIGVPLVLAVLGAWFQKTQQEQSERLSKEQRIQSEQLSKKQKEQDADETREEVLQLYLDRISSLLLDKNLMVIAAKNAVNEYAVSEEKRENLEVSIGVIKARTLSILRRFAKDAERKSDVVRFLVEADVLGSLKISLSKTDLSFANLSEINLCGANLCEANLREADLSSANLVGANLSQSNLSAANLSRARLIGANLQYARLNAANLGGADLHHARLSVANLISVDLSYADLSHASLNTANLGGAVLSYTGLSYSNLRGVNLSKAILCGADLSYSNLCGANLREADLSTPNKNDEYSGKTNLSNASLKNVSLRDADLSNADLSNVNLNRANLRGTNLRYADLSNADLSNVNLNRANLRGTNLRNADLSYVDMSGAETLTASQIEPALLCCTQLPNDIDLNPNRDCKKLGIKQP